MCFPGRVGVPTALGMGLIDDVGAEFVSSGLLSSQPSS